MKQKPRWHKAATVKTIDHVYKDVLIAFWGAFFFIAENAEDAKADNFTALPVTDLMAPFKVDGSPKL